jgi:hypothetical protein
LAPGPRLDQVSPYRFDAPTRKELRDLLGAGCGVVITELEAAASRYADGVRARRRLTPVLRRAQDDTARIRRKARALLAAIDAAHPIVRQRLNFRAGPPGSQTYRATISAVAARRPGKDGPPVNYERHDLENAVGRALQRHGARLTTASNGTLARVLVAILGDDAPDVDALKRICRRVRDEVQG